MEQSLAPNTVARTVHSRLRHDILAGVLPAGEKLRSATLASRYGCVPIPVREALSRLTGEGLVIHSEQRGFAVAPISLEDFADLTRARLLIAEAALRASIEHGDADWEERVLVAHHRLSKAQRWRDSARGVPDPDFDRLHREFHSALLSGCGSRRLLDLCEELFDQVQRYRNLSMSFHLKPRDDEHSGILQAALARDAERAASLIRGHIQRTYEIVAGHAQRAAPDDGSEPR